jgi:hypothetical protein
LFVSALTKTLYHEHIIDYHPYDTFAYLEKISTLRLIIAGILVGFGSQYASENQRNDGFLGVPRLTLRSISSYTISFVVCVLAATYKIHKFIPTTPRILDIELSKNISFTAYLLVSLLIPFICFLLSPKKSFKGLIESILLFLIGTGVGFGFMVAGLSKKSTTFDFLELDKTWKP